jgi:GNAT superfamily N-acetyltransferase
VIRVTARHIIRKARRSDTDALVAFTLQEARDAEGVELDVARVTRGVEAAFDNPPRATYWVAETPSRELVASMSVVTEWSNFHGGDYWWIQSLFIVPEHRGSGLLEQLLDRLAADARAGGALELRLYAHEANERALRAYTRGGFTRRPYSIMRRALR